MKDPWDWTEEDLILPKTTGQQESLTLEYKAAEALQKTDGCKNELSKDVSAFANAVGGTIVYGMTETPDDHYPDQIKGCDPAVITQEWLEQVINTHIQRRIAGVRIKRISLLQSDPGKVAYVIYIPQSAQAPHQAHDKRFYRRFNFASIPMEEYEIRDVSRRGEAPDLSIELYLVDPEPVALRFTGGREKSDLIRIQGRITNSAPQPAEVVVLRIFLDGRIETPLPPFRYLGDGQAKIGERMIPVRIAHLNWGPGSSLPVFEGLPFSIFDPPLEAAFPPHPDDYVIGVEIHSPRMAARQSVYILRSDGAEVKIVAFP